MNQKTLDIGGTMSLFAKIKHPVLAACGLAVTAAAILIGAGFVGSNSHPAAKPTGPWRAIAHAPESIAAGRTTVWTGTEMIVAGVKPGSDGTFIHSSEVAEAYNPATDTWRKLAEPSATPSYCRRDAVWTGKEMLVWGCNLLSYDPAANAWRRLPDPPTRHGIVAWTGRELIGWGGGCCGDVSDDGSAYNPATNSWRKLSPAPISGQQSPIGAFTGRELVIFNGHGPEGDRVGGAAYNPKTDTWRHIPSQPGIRALTAVYDGNEIYAVGGPRVLAFNPSNDSWRQLPRTALGAGDLTAVWTGNRLIVAGSTTSAYDPPRDLWKTLSSSPLEPRQDAEAVWTGRELILWGGLVPTSAGNPTYLADGAALRPPKYSPPLPQCCGG
jgi:hypothetical protein